MNSVFLSTYFQRCRRNEIVLTFKQMENNPLYQDIMKNGLLRKKIIHDH